MTWNRLFSLSILLALVGAGLVIAVNNESSPRTSITSPSPGPNPDPHHDSNQGAREAELLDLERRVKDLEQALLHLQDSPRVGLPGAEQAAPGGPPVLVAPEDLKLRLTPTVMEIMDDWDEERVRQEYLKHIEERVELKIRTKSISPEAKWRVIETLEEVRRDVVDLERRYVKGTFPPTYGTEEWRLWRGAWDALLEQWDGPVRHALVAPPPKMPRMLILEMASERLQPYEE